jgi:hypothetical protein
MAMQPPAMHAHAPVLVLVLTLCMLFAPSPHAHCASPIGRSHKKGLHGSLTDAQDRVGGEGLALGVGGGGGAHGAKVNAKDERLAVFCGYQFGLR